MSFFDLFRRQTQEVTGTVERVGLREQYGGSSLWVLLEGQSAPYTLYVDTRGDEPLSLAGLTVAGDKVVMQVTADRTVSSNGFRNLTLEARLPHYVPAA